MAGAGRGGGVGDVLALLDLAVEATEVVVLHAVDAVGAGEGLFQRGPVRRVGLDHLGAQAGEGPCRLAVGLAGEGPHLPPPLEQAPGDGSALQARRPHDCDHLAPVLGHGAHCAASTAAGERHRVWLYTVAAPAGMLSMIDQRGSGIPALSRTQGAAT